MKLGIDFSLTEIIDLLIFSMILLFTFSMGLRLIKGDLTQKKSSNSPEFCKKGKNEIGGIILGYIVLIGGIIVFLSYIVIQFLF